MKKWIISIIVVAALAGLGFLALEGGLLQATASEMAPKAATVLPAVKASNQIIAEAKVVPVRYAALSLPAGGVVAQVAVAEGERVKAGQVLVRVEAAQQAAAVAQAEAGLRRAQAQLDSLKAGPRPQEIAAAQAAVEGAQAQLAKITQSARPEEIAAAEAALASAQATLNRVLKGPEEDEITVAAADLRRTEVALQQAQWAYDQVAYAANVGASPEAAKLEQATLDYKTAQARYHLAVRGPTEADVAAAKAQLAQAEAALASLKGTREADVAAAQAEIHRVQAQLELLRTGARPEEVAAAEAEVAAAEATLAQAQAALTQTELRAPFAGTVAALDARVGEEAAAGAPLVRLADFSAWQVETDDLTELSVVQVKESAPVTITVDAIPGLELLGHVLRVKGIGEDKQGDMTYTVVVQPDRPDERLRWNMTAAVFIEPR
jgi:HlyD family secretion protein